MKKKTDNCSRKKSIEYPIGINKQIGSLCIHDDYLIDEIHADIISLIQHLKKGELIASRMTTEEWKQIYLLTDSLYNDFSVYIKIKHPKLTLHDIRLSCLLLLGFSGQELRVIFDAKDGHTISKAKLRLKERLELSKNKSIEEYIYQYKKRKL